MIAIGLLFLRALCDWFKARRRLEVEILVLRHQLNILRQRTPRRQLRLRWVDRALFIWLYRCCPGILNAITNISLHAVLRLKGGTNGPAAAAASISVTRMGTYWSLRRRDYGRSIRLSGPNPIFGGLNARTTYLDETGSGRGGSAKDSGSTH
jgi:hypothetical protein